MDRGNNIVSLDLANFMLPGKVKVIGGAMDLVANPEKTRVIVTMVGRILFLSPFIWRLPATGAC